MSKNNAIPPLSRPSSAQSATGQASNGAASNGVDGVTDGNGGNADDGDTHSAPVPERIHDHTRPFPPPRLPPSVPGTTSPSSTSTSTTTTTTLLTSAALPGRVSPGRTAPLSPLSNTFRSRPTLRRPQNTETSPIGGNSRNLLSTDTGSVPRSPVGEVSLTVPRPDGERAINEYVETPFKACCNQERRLDTDGKRGNNDCSKLERRHHHHRHHKTATSSMIAPTHRQQRHPGTAQLFRGVNASAVAAATTTTTTTTNPNPVGVNAITKQPVSFTKEPANVFGSRSYDPAGLSIMCDFCGKCRCESCREPPPLPSKWLCNNSCFCSAETVLDYASCLCCVKGLFYHCADGGGGGSGVDGEAGDSCADEPCSCTGNRKTARWACLGALTLVLPCLLCYWPFKGCVAVCEACYARHAAQGCRCNPGSIRHHPLANDIGDSRDPEKRLLDPVTPEL